MFHIFVDIVFLTDFGAEGVPHLIPPVSAQSLHILVGCQHFVHSAALLSADKTSELNTSDLEM